MSERMEIRIQIKGNAELQEKLKANTAAGPANRFFNRVGGEVQRRAKPLAPVNTGTLKRSISFKVQDATPIPRRVEIGTFGTNVSYAPFVEFGRKPGRKPPPYGQIEWWYRRKNKLGLKRTTIKVDDKQVSIAGIAKRIAWSIGRKGIKPKPFLGQAAEESIVSIQQHLYTFAREIEEEYGRGRR
jgi:hypothetical protein